MRHAACSIPAEMPRGIGDRPEVRVALGMPSSVQGWWADRFPRMKAAQAHRCRARASSSSLRPSAQCPRHSRAQRANLAAALAICKYGGSKAGWITASPAAVVAVGVGTQLVLNLVRTRKSVTSCRFSCTPFSAMVATPQARFAAGGRNFPGLDQQNPNVADDAAHNGLH